ncbi:MAG: type II secretion system minor pseudopilin GspI [Thermodesulfobacteriota bacterium]
MTGTWSLRRGDEGEGSRGFTLLEVLISLSIIAIVLIACLRAQNQSIRLYHLSRDLTTATILARQKMGEIELEGFPELGEDEGDFEDKFPGFTWKKAVSMTPFEEARRVDLSIIWKEGNREKTVDVVAYITNTKTE